MHHTLNPSPSLHQFAMRLRLCGVPCTFVHATLLQRLPQRACTCMRPNNTRWPGSRVSCSFPIANVSLHIRAHAHAHLPHACAMHSSKSEVLSSLSHLPHRRIHMRRYEVYGSRFGVSEEANFGMSVFECVIGGMFLLDALVELQTPFLLRYKNDRL